MTTRRSFLHLSLGAVAVTCTAVTLPHVAQGQGRTFEIKTRDGIGLFVKDTGGYGRAVVMTHAWPLNADIWDQYLGFEIDAARYPKLARYLRAITATEAFQRALADERPFVDQMGLKRDFLSAA